MTNWDEVANKADIDNIDVKIGESTDNETKQTLFGKLWVIRNVVDWIKTWLTDKLDMKISTVNTSALDAAQKAEAARVAALAASGSVVKSVQHGSTATSSQSVIVTISRVDLSKSVIMVQDCLFSASSVPSAERAGGYFINDTSIRINTSRSGEYSVKWQVIEFY